jgi:hypothetical protein
MIKIKICDVAPRGACSYYRGIGPLSKLRHINPEIQIEYLEAVSWTALADCDILYLVRPVENNYIETIELARSFGVPVWVDFDDNLHLVPADNPGHEYFSQEHILKNITYAITAADIVTFSTPAIKEFYQKLRPDSIVIPNAFNDYNYKLATAPNDTKIISWRGSNTHRNDLLSVKDDMVQVANSHPDWQWVFIGGDPLWYITEAIKNSSGMKEMEIVRYNRFMINLKPSIHITPLLCNDFNHGKSNISFLEAVFVGAAALAPEIPEFLVPGCVNYRENFSYLLEKLIKSKSYRKEQWEKSLTYIKENLMLSQINQKRIKIIDEVLK